MGFSKSLSILSPTPTRTSLEQSPAVKLKPSKKGTGAAVTVVAGTVAVAVVAAAAVVLAGVAFNWLPSLSIGSKT